MAKFGDFCKIASSYADVADFVTVYIEEAHPVESFALRNNLKINAHNEIDDRIEAAKHLLTKRPPFPIVCDVMDDTAKYDYGCVNERLYVILRCEIAYEGGQGPMYYSLVEVQQWLDNYLQLSQKIDRPMSSDDVIDIERKQLLEDLRRHEGNASKRSFFEIINLFIRA